VGYRGTVHFTSSDPHAILPHSYTFTTADAGSHTFTAALLTVGPQTITVIDDTGLTDTFNVVVTPASFTVSGFPSEVTAGDTDDFKVVALDFFGNVATGYRGRVHFSSTDPKAVLPADYTFTAGDMGTGTFTATLVTAGIQSITVADMLAPNQSKGTESDIQVNPAAVSNFVVSGFPSTTQAGVAHDFSVTAKDAYGNVATNYTGTIHFTSNDPNGSLPNDYTFSAADAGTHTFSATLVTAGTRSITISDSVNGVAATTNGILVTPGAAVSLNVEVLPNPAPAGENVFVYVTAVDAYGNKGAVYTGTVHFSSSDSAATLPADYKFTAADNGSHLFSGIVFRTRGIQSLLVNDTINTTIAGEQDDVQVV
jgi:hypothetical protein